MALFLFIFFINNLWCQNWNRFEIETPKWAHGMWVSIEYEPFRIAVEPEYIAFTHIWSTDITPLNERFLPESIARSFLVGSYFAVSSYSNVESAYIFANENEPFTAHRRRPDLSADGEYLRVVHLFKFDVNNPNDDRWIYTIHYYRKI